MQLARRAAGLKAVSYPILAVGPEDAQGYCLAVGLRAGRLPDAPQVSEVLCVCVTTVSRGWPKPRPAPKPYSVHDWMCVSGCGVVTHQFCLLGGPLYGVVLLQMLVQSLMTPLTDCLPACHAFLFLANQHSTMSLAEPLLLYWRILRAQRAGMRLPAPLTLLCCGSTRTA
jgi:hypothetical protein